MTQEPSLWLGIYRQLRTYLPTTRSYYQQKSLLPSELEEKVIEMHRLSRNWTSEAPDIKQRKLFVPTSDPDDRILCMDLHPGGRWLVTSSSNAVVSWDLDAADIQQSMHILIRFEHPGPKLGKRRFSYDPSLLPEIQHLVTMQEYMMCANFARLLWLHTQRYRSDDRRVSQLAIWEIRLQPEPTSSQLWSYLLPPRTENICLDHDIVGFVSRASGATINTSAVLIDWKSSSESNYLVASAVRDLEHKFNSARMVSAHCIQLDIK